ncbi:hypothetical protein F2Q69_00004737 [Brassica cretica]|uniref:Uncharacterized protein n=1 Tax=Brassica cretica TaxID=69181 RepID=A0A8S9PDB0_BRACR|nr:hypothetical protein F2Q69_00004737 [Brassica cretica]
MSSRDPTRQYPYASQYASHPDLHFIPLLVSAVKGVKSALFVSQGDPPDLWQPPGYGVSLPVNHGHGGGGSIPGAGNFSGWALFRTKDHAAKYIYTELHRRVRCLAMDEDLTTFEANQHPVAEVMPVLLKSGQSASREEAVEEMKDCRSMKQHWYMPISIRSSKEELLFFSDPTRLERSIRKKNRASLIDTTSTRSTLPLLRRSTPPLLRRSTFVTATIDSSTRTSIDTNPRADMVATLVLQRDENGDLRDPGGHLCNATCKKIDGQVTAILGPSAATEDKVPLQRSLADLTRPISLVEHAVEKDEDHNYIEKMESMIEKVLKIQQTMSAYLNLRLDVLYKELNGKIETLDAHVMMLDAQISETAEAVKNQEALVKGKDVESKRHQVNVISDDDFGEVLEQETLEEDAFLVESCMSIGSSYWCRPTSTTEHRSTSSAEHR